MPNNRISSSQWEQDLVLLAKNTYVWLAQLSRKYSRPILMLDQIPQEELDEIHSIGITGLWLVGLWERSPASRRIKQLYGYDHLIGSAYSINGYEVAADLGGELALGILGDKAAKAGISLACDMVPNHAGLDCPWILDHPDWYIGTLKKPVSTWEFNSENLSPLDGIQIRIEDGYYTQQEAAEAFQYTSSSGVGPLYIYHGNDGTSMPWNDTAQHNYLNPRLREEVKKQILNVARRFKIIRLDAAMTLLRHHFKRLWYPDPDGEKFIPTRNGNPMTQDEFDALMPNEFWAENKDWIIDVIRGEGRPALLELWQERYYYFILKYERPALSAAGQSSTLATIQIDVESGMDYIEQYGKRRQKYDIVWHAKDGSTGHPIILHNSPSGGIERVIWALLEGNMRYQNTIVTGFKTWLSPVQVRVLTVSEKEAVYAEQIMKDLNAHNIRCDYDDRDETVAKKIRQAEVEWMP